MMYMIINKMVYMYCALNTLYMFVNLNGLLVCHVKSGSK